MLSTAQLDSMRATLGDLFTETVIRRRFTFTTNDYGNDERAAPTDVTYAGRLIQASSLERRDDRDLQLTEWSVLLPYTADVKGSDQIIVGSRTFEAIGAPVFKPSPGEATHMRVSLTAIEGGG